MTRSPLILLAFALGCGNRITGTVDDVEVGTFADAVYSELRYVDVGITNHDLAIWLMPMEDSCTVFPALLEALAAARAAISDAGLDPEGYCDLWESVWAEHVGLDPFWIARYQIRAQPRPGDAEIEAEYPWHDRNRVNDFAVFDADLARYPAPTFSACAEEFEDDGQYTPTLHAATGGSLEVTRYTEDESLEGRVEMTLDAAEGGAVTGSFQTEFCPAAQEWPLEFGLGL
jgi:hypothetical protein